MRLQQHSCVYKEKIKRVLTKETSRRKNSICMCATDGVVVCVRFVCDFKQFVIYLENRLWVRSRFRSEFRSEEDPASAECCVCFQ